MSAELLPAASAKTLPHRARLIARRAMAYYALTRPHLAALFAALLVDHYLV